MTGTVVLEALAQCGTAAFDKTGTLTTGQLAATSMRRPDTAAVTNGAAPQHSRNGAQSAQTCVTMNAGLVPFVFPVKFAVQSLPKLKILGVSSLLQRLSSHVQHC